ncbi:retrovirus-related Pol polyprotein from transposon TNT 1-94 [Cucumis melo var. makuwa]|uniref:Retrovirus-related Pol polyprotein from transposon TNT 1-94 n=1 Tax=Cucumis melo var. makuwa TaxID=1194695 RepID=A0A5D3CAI4_CUCMM|nr:retrovirus-related Pol polyprotein from transposon TNT 1-94 [Cucumis melo var. makuwa]TYK08214.1 retrovirus-related Pol polyprotein from transposon TNT 1-94 [Cucumis melo var. makuwa]
MWKKLDELYQSKDLPNRAYVRERFFTFKMDDNKSLIENLGEFKKLSSDFKELGDKIGDENESFILLNSLPEAYKEVKMALRYGRQKITTGGVISAIRTRELDLNSQRRDQSNGEGLFSKGLVYMGNDNACKIVGIGSVTLKFKDGTATFLRNMRHVPSLKRNLIFLGMLDSIGCEYKGSAGRFEILKDFKIVLFGTKINGLFLIKEAPMNHDALIVSNDKLTEVEGD